MPPALSVVAVLAAAILVGCTGAATAAPAVPVRALATGATAEPVPAPTTEATSAAPATLASPPASTTAPAPRSTPHPTTAPLGPIVALGDSLTYGYGLGVTTAIDGPAPAHSYPWDMARDLGIPVVNAGISGTTAHEVLDPSSASQPRPVDLQLPALLELHPRLMVVGFGTNEAWLGQPIPQAVADLRQLLSLIAAAHVPIVLLGTHLDCTAMACPTSNPGQPSPQLYTTAWDAALTALAAEYHAGLVLDVEHGFTPADMTDWIHCDASGYQIMADRIETAVRARLA
jgi:lysophospholipase L1-like esterase